MQTGDLLPDLTMQTTGGELPLRSLVGRPLLIYFYPKDSTPGCTRQANELTALQARFDALGVRLLGVSRDTLSSHERFRDKQAISFDLASDRDEALCQAFGVIKEKNMYGRKVLGIERSSFLFDRDGRLAQSWRGIKVPGHADTVLAAAEALA